MFEWLKDFAEALNDLRVLPRTMVALYGLIMYEVSVWFMGLEDPTNSQAAFISTIYGAAAAIFGLYVNTGSVAGRVSGSDGRKGRR